jgi:hypothetical protein
MENSSHDPGEFRRGIKTWLVHTFSMYLRIDFLLVEAFDIAGSFI